MANSYFQFKQFRIEQADCAMKISTDACLFGAVVPTLSAGQRALDIGTGTGLLALMLAQRSAMDCLIDAVELEPKAAIQAAFNVQQSPWSAQIRVWSQPIQQFQPGLQAEYSLILANPPFFQSGSRALHHQRAAARHTDTLSFNDLLAAVQRLLSHSGQFWLLLPASEQAAFERLAKQQGLYCAGGIRVAPTEGRVVNRYISCWQPRACLAEWSDLSIRQASADYSSEFCQRLAPYYLHL